MGDSKGPKWKLRPASRAGNLRREPAYEDSVAPGNPVRIPTSGQRPRVPPVDWNATCASRPSNAFGTADGAPCGWHLGLREGGEPPAPRNRADCSPSFLAVLVSERQDIGGTATAITHHHGDRRVLPEVLQDGGEDVRAAFHHEAHDGHTLPQACNAHGVTALSPRPPILGLSLNPPWRGGRSPRCEFPSGLEGHGARWPMADGRSQR